MEDSTEALATSQLETLYRLGILERGSEDAESVESRKNERSGLLQRHDAFLAALPPPSAVFSVISRRVQTFGDESDSSQYSCDSRSSGFCESSDGASSISRHRLSSRPRRSSRLRSSASSAESSVLPLSRSAKRDRRTLRTWFRQWRHFVRHRRQEARRRAIVDAFLKQKVITKWACFLKQRRYEHDKQRLLGSWKVSRAISRWVHWKQRCHLLRDLLERGRRSFMGRLILQRMWRRWIQFAKQTKYVHVVLAQRTNCIHRLLLRNVWDALRIHVFRARQARIALRRCFKVLHGFLSIQEQQRTMCTQYRGKSNLKRKREFLNRWRTVANKSGRDRRLACQVQFDVRRRRYFVLWCEVARTTSIVERQRAKLLSRVFRDHFLAWDAATKAIQLGDKVRKNREKHLRAIYFEAFKNQASFSAHSNRAQLMITRHRLAIAIERLQARARERKRRREGIRRVQQMWQTRLVRCAWSEGWLKIHRKRLAWKHACLASESRYLSVWKRFICGRQAWHHQEKRAEELHSKFCCQRTLANWKSYYKYRLDHAQQLVRAQQHHHKHLLHLGVICLWGAVYQNTQNSLRGHHLRQKMRTSLKKRHFQAWQALARSRRKLSDQLNYLQLSPGYQKSICNPCRRRWNRWIVFVFRCRQRHRCDELYQLRTKRRVLLNWHRQATLGSCLRALGSYKSKQIVGALFTHWKCRVEKWRKVRAICELAERVYDRKLCTRVIRGWHRRSTNWHRVRLCGESVQHQRKAKLQAMWFLTWKEKFHSCQRLSRLRRTHAQRQLRSCFTNWHKRSAQQKVFSRKLTHFHQVFGKYPASSAVSRAWHRWQQASKLCKYTKLLHRKLQLRQARQCWSHWKMFHVACQILREWRRVARTMSSSNNNRGARLRYLRESRRYRLQMFMIAKWKCLVERRRNLQERQSLWKTQLNRELDRAAVRSRQATLLRLRRWFRRWHIGCSKSSLLARDHFHTRLLLKTMLGWWKSIIHSKQEKVLVEAQQTIGKLSYYHPQQQNYIAQSKRISNLKREKKLPRRKTKVMSKEAINTRVESMRKMRRMLDPTENASYVRNYQDGGNEISHTEPNARATVIVATQHDDAATVDRLEFDSEPRRQIFDNQTPSGDTISRNHHLRCGDNEIHDGKATIDTTEGTIHSQPVAIHNSCPETIAHDAELLQRLLLLDSTNSNQLCPESRYLESENHLYQEDASREIHDSIPGNMLPLFDDDTVNRDAFDQTGNTHQEKYVTTGVHAIKFASNFQKEREANTVEQFSCTKQHGFDPNGRMPKSVCDDRRKCVDTFSSRGYDFDVCAPMNATPAMFEPSLSLVPVSESNSTGRDDKLSVVKTRHTAHKKLVKGVNLRCNNESRSLADILKLNDSTGPKRSEHGNGLADVDAQWNDGPVCDVTVIREIVGFYADSVLIYAGTKTSGNELAKVTVTRMSICYRMVRDLALLQNDFYIGELQKVFDASFKEKYIELSRYAVDADKHEEQLKLEQFLEVLVESHPAYRKYLDICIRQDSSRSPTPLSALSWLAQRHLQPYFLLQKRARARPRKTKAYWVWEPMPTDMDLALEKLLPTIRKYMRILGQFFLRQAVQSCSATDKTQDYRISSTAFIALMKQVRVFPQLFHRRELENAVKLSACSSPDTEALNFPEFIEALVRCSCKLHWGELDGGRHSGETNSDDTVIVIKFVMLIFAMEGQGSVLKKRNEDVGAILGFLGQQQKKKQAHKLYRFRKMLVDDKRRARESREYHPPSVWSQVRLQFSPKPSPTRSPAKSHDTFDELTASWDGGSPQIEPFVFDASTNQPFGLDLSPVPSAESSDRQCGWHSGQEYAREEHIQCRLPSDSIEETNLRPPFTTEESPPTHADKIAEVCYQSSLLDSTNDEPVTQRDVSPLDSDPNAVDVERSEVNESSVTRQVDTRSSSRSLDDGMPMDSDNNELQLQAITRSAGLTELMEKDEFLREILSSIGDVELLLSHSQISDRNLSRQDNRKVRRSHSTLSDDYIGHGFPSLSELAAGSASYTDFDDAQVTRVICMDSEVDREVAIRDPMLNYLTDIDRFTESTDQTSLLSVVDMGGVPFAQYSASQNMNDLNVDTCTHQETTSIATNTGTQSATDES